MARLTTTGGLNNPSSFNTRRFNHFKEKYPNLSSVMWVCKSVAGMNLSNIQIKKYVKLIEKEDCPKSLIEGVEKHLQALTKDGKAEDTKIGA